MDCDLMRCQAAAPEEITHQVTSEQNSWTILMRQIAVSVAVCSMCFQVGLCLGSPPVVVAQFRRENVTVTDEQVSWYSSAYYNYAIPWCIIIPVMSYYISQRLIFGLIAFISVVGFTIFYFSTSLSHVTISAAVQGSLVAGQLTVGICIVAEYTSPVYRGVFQPFKSASIHWGIWVGNALGTFSDWKMIGVLGIICGIFNLIMVFIWPDSPYWLAAKGRYEQTRKAHRWLKGTTKKSEEELESLMNYFKIQASLINESNESKFRVLLKNIASKEFYMPVLLSCLIVLVLQTTGKYIIAMYALDILHKITGSQSTAYIGMMILDGVAVLGMYIGSYCSRYINRRKMFFGFESISLTFLCITSLYLYLIHLNVVSENPYVTITLLSIYVLAMCCGPMLLCTLLYGDLMPLRFRILAMIVTAFTFTLFSGTLLKLCPLIFKLFEIHGGFLFLAISAFIPCVFLYIYLPETRNKTLIEIQSYFKSTPSKKEEYQKTDVLLGPLEKK